MRMMQCTTPPTRVLHYDAWRSPTSSHIQSSPVQSTPYCITTAGLLHHASQQRQPAAPHAAFWKPPVEPKPPAPLLVSSRSSTSTTSGVLMRSRIIWAILSPFLTVAVEGGQGNHVGLAVRSELIGIAGWCNAHQLRAACRRPRA